MPLYRFLIDSPLPAREVALRIGALAREGRGFFRGVGEYSGPGDAPVPPFLGTVSEQSFSLRRDIHYRNSFLPQVRGKIEPAATGGARVVVTMYLHRAVFLFMLFWLGGVATAAFSPFSAIAAPINLVPAGLFVFGCALSAIGFYPEAVKARRILEQAVGPAGT